MIKELAVKHPYYCCDKNHYSKDARMRWETMTDFLNEFEEADVDMNLVFRWDIKIRRSRSGIRREDPGSAYAEVFMMLQRNGIFKPHYIHSVTDEEAMRFRAYVKKHWRKIQQLWKPISEGKHETED